MRLKLPNTNHISFNVIGFNTIWLLCVFYGNALILVPVVLLIIHLLSVKKLINELVTMGLIACFGVTVDSLLTLFSVYSFDETQASFLGLPLWLIILWFGFSATINHSFSFVAKSWLFQLLMGFILLPLNYFYGYKLNAVNFNYTIEQTLFILVFVWGISTPLMFYCLHCLQQKCPLTSMNND